MGGGGGGGAGAAGGLKKADIHSRKVGSEEEPSPLTTPTGIRGGRKRPPSVANRSNAGAARRYASVALKVCQSEELDQYDEMRSWTAESLEASVRIPVAGKS